METTLLVIGTVLVMVQFPIFLFVVFPLAVMNNKIALYIFAAQWFIGGIATIIANQGSCDYNAIPFIPRPLCD